MIAKCGKIVVWHWSHRAGKDCDVWAEPESAWHLTWKQQLPAAQVEVSLRKNGIAHRADIRRSDGTVVELQHSPLAPEEIQLRESFYGKMVWLFDLQDCRKWDEYTSPRFQLFKRDRDFWTFRWKHPRKSISFARMPVVFDLGPPDGLFLLKKIYVEKSPCGGWGVPLSSYDFSQWLQGNEDRFPVGPPSNDNAWNFLAQVERAGYPLLEFRWAKLNSKDAWKSFVRKASPTDLDIVENALRDRGLWFLDNKEGNSIYE